MSCIQCGVDDAVSRISGLCGECGDVSNNHGQDVQQSEVPDHELSRFEDEGGCIEWST